MGKLTENLSGPHGESSILKVEIRKICQSSKLK